MGDFRPQCVLVAYQGHARGLGAAAVWSVNIAALGATLPDLVVWLDMEPEAALARQQGTDRIGSESIDLHRRVREGYENMSTVDSNIVRVDAAGPPDDTLRQVLSVLRHSGWLPGQP